MLLLPLAFIIDGDELGSIMKNSADRVKLSLKPFQRNFTLILHRLGRGMCLHQKTKSHIIITQPIARNSAAVQQASVCILGTQSRDTLQYLEKKGNQPWLVFMQPGSLS